MALNTLCKKKQGDHCMLRSLQSLNVSHSTQNNATVFKKLSLSHCKFLNKGSLNSDSTLARLTFSLQDYVKKKVVNNAPVSPAM